MKKLLLAMLALSAATLRATASSPDFSVELFSNRTVKALTLQATRQTVSVCGAEGDGACVLLPPSSQLSCFADRLIHCHTGSAERTFKLLAVHSAAPFRIVPTFAPASAPAEAFFLHNAQVRPGGAGLQIVARVDLEEYVSGVLRGEASILQTPAARAAMAVVARTWALRWRGRHGERGFDFCSLTHCQVFRLPHDGNAGAPHGIDPAALATRGQVLTFHGQLADPYFTACCGGVTEAAGNVWPDRAQPYLISIHDPYCVENVHAFWKQALASDRVERVLRQALHLPIAAPLGELSVEKRDSSGRAAVLRVVAGAAWNIDANRFRYAVGRRYGWEQIKSNLYSIARQGSSWTFAGHGLGHGVGLCQAGAEQMARRGFSTASILSTYFPGTEVDAPIPSDPVASSEHFELLYPDSQTPWVRQTLDTLEQWRRELGAHAQLPPPRLRVQTFATTGDFIHATGAPGWMAGASDGQSVSLQPLQLLARKRLLNQTLRHELTHVVVHRVCAKGVPRWLEEGWVLYLTGEKIEAPATPFKPEKELESAVVTPRSEAEMKAAYAQALERVRQLVRREGEAAVWRLIETGPAPRQGVP